MDLDWGFVPINEISDRGIQDLTFDGLLKEPLKVHQDGGAAGCGGRLWPAGELLSRYLIRQPQIPYRKIIELGSGTGLAGLAVAVGHPEADFELYITDQENLMHLMEENIILNDQQDRVKAEVLNWGEELPEYAKNADLILAADCVYLEKAFPLLEKTLLDLTNDGTRVLMAYKKRRKADKNFFKAIKKNFDVVEIKDFPEFEKFHREVVYLFEIVRRNPPLKQIQNA